PEVMADVVAPFAVVRPRDMDRALALDVTDDVRHRELRRDRQHHVDVVGHDVALLHTALLLLGKLAEHRTEMFAKLPEKRLASILRDEHHVEFTLPRRMAKVLVIVHVYSVSCALSGSRSGVHGRPT